MLTDRSRLDGYCNALKSVITPDSVVLDLGAGIGIFSILACEYGAKKVYAVEANPLIKLVKETAVERGYQSRIQILQDFSHSLELEKKANVMVSDIHGGFPLYESSIETIIDARNRLLTKDAILIPSKETIKFAPSQSEKIYKENVSKFLGEFKGFKVPSSERFVLNRWFSAKDENEILLSESAIFAEIDYRTVDQTSFSSELVWEINQEGSLDGFRGWFESELSRSNLISNSIDKEETTYARPFFPLEQRVDVNSGDIVKVLFTADYEDDEYFWSWRTKIFEQGTKNQLKAEFVQSSLASVFLAPDVALKQSEYFIPSPNKTAEIDLFILNLIDGKTLQGDIAETLVEKYSEKFKTYDDGLNYVSAISQKYSE